MCYNYLGTNLGVRISKLIEGPEYNFSWRCPQAGALTPRSAPWCARLQWPKRTVFYYLPSMVGSLAESLHRLVPLLESNWGANCIRKYGWCMLDFDSLSRADFQYLLQPHAAYSMSKKGLSFKRRLAAELENIVAMMQNTHWYMS